MKDKLSKEQSATAVTGALNESAKVEQLMAIFAECFAGRENTRLVRGTTEPIYLPADAECNHHRVIFAHGFFSSALHEVAHWCIAGAARRLQVDYGYWYCPDGRTAEQQRLFEQVEARPQALEWIFSRAAGHRFRISVDNLGGALTDPAPFRAAVCREAKAWCERGLGKRAARFQQALAQHFGGDARLDPHSFQEHELLPWQSSDETLRRSMGVM